MLKETIDKYEKMLKITSGLNKVLRQFKNLVSRMKPVTPYAGTSTEEGFAETFAMYKLSPRGIKRLNKRLAKWFERNAYLRVK